MSSVFVIVSFGNWYFRYKMSEVEDAGDTG